jgi:diguanylate cyclase (GGDEF)-like protein/PAS domain S-box-containing protein
MTEVDRQDSTVEYLSGLQRTLVDASKRFISLDAGELDDTITEVLGQVGSYCAVDRSYLFRFSPDGSLLDNTHEWCGEGTTPQIDNLQQLPRDLAPKAMALLERRQVVHVSRVTDLPPEWGDEKALFEAQDVQSLVLVPVFVGNDLYGFLGFDSVRHQRDWGEEEIGLLEVLADLLGSLVERETSASALRESEILRTSAERLAQLGSWAWNLESDRLTPSEEWRRVTGCMDEPLFISDVVALVHPDDQAEVEKQLKAAIEDGVPYEIEHRIFRRCDAALRWIRVHAEVRTRPDHGREMYGFAQDITERKLGEIQRHGEHEVLASIAAGERLDQSLDTLARVVEHILPDSVCTVVLLRPDGKHITHGASPSISQAFSTAIEGAAIGPRAGSCGTAMYLDESIITPDIREDPKWQEWRSAADAEGLRACWSQPIHGSSGQVMGSFAVYYRQPRSPADEELAVLSRMRNLAGIAIERYQSGEKLRHREALYRATFEHAAVGIAHVAPDGRYIRVNPKLCELLGYPESELRKMRVRDVTHPEDVERDAAGVGHMLRGETDSYHTEKRYRRKDGTTLWANLSAGVVRNEEGEVDRFVVVVEDVSDARRLSEELTFQARHDSLTGLINRNEFDKRLRDYLKGSLRDQEAGGVCYLDLDQFKLVNDTVGHVAGDEVLRQLGPELKHQIRNSDALARLGGDEFGVLLPGCSTEDAAAVAEKLRRAVEEHPFVWGDKTFKLSVSIGVVPLAGASLPSVTEVLQAADTVCYTAKDSGRNRVVVWREDDASLYRRHGEMQWVPRLNRALDEDMFVLFAQPIVPLAPAARYSDWYEILVRLNDEGTVISPGAFLPAAERYGLSPRLDRLIVQKTLDWLRAHQERGKDLSVSINLSGLSFGDDDFQRFLTEALGDSLDLAPQLCFEITETAAISNLTEAASLIESIRGLGSRIALDDFGSGLSSFAYLKALPVDYLKIDGTFVRDIARDAIDRSIVRSIREVGQVMGKETIAEFVESEDVVEVLRELEVDYAQGFWLGHPAPLDDI